MVPLQAGLQADLRVGEARFLNHQERSVQRRPAAFGWADGALGARWWRRRFSPTGPVGGQSRWG
jgi:hypothetical protein